MRRLALVGMLVGLLVGSLSLLVPVGASAQGFEYSVQGTRAFGRGGAFAARGDDPSTLGLNPAGMLEWPGYPLQIGTHLAFHDACVERAGTYNDSVPDGVIPSRFGPIDSADPGNWINQRFPRVCNGGYPAPSPNVVFTGRITPDLAFGIGLLAPSGVNNGLWGAHDATVVGPDGRLLPSPVRYGLVEQDLLLFYPTFGLAWRPTPWLRLGAAFEWGMAIVRFVNFTNAGAGPEDPGTDVRTQLDVSDLFVPAIVGSVHIVPADSLDIVLHTRISDGINDSGTLTVTTGTFGDPAMSDSYQPYTTRFPGTTLQAGQPWTFGLAIRYSDRNRWRASDPAAVTGLTGRVEDHMQRENWDLELDVTYTHNSQVRDFIVTVPAGSDAGICTQTDGCPEGPTIGAALDRRDAMGNRVPKALPIPHGWNDQVSFRLGGDLNLLPGQFTLRGGLSFTTSGFSSRYQTQDFMPAMRFGLYLGATVRFERLDISFAYAHIFQIDESTVDANFRPIAAIGSEGQCEDAGGDVYDPSNPVTARGCYPQGFGAVVNNGRYTADFNVLSLQVSYHFE
ncbi:MAG: hypothetical protein IT378_18600 [Sandaracinaceae bacterium]|nr:hypothetical protein [Sandaracinaceae bacterium]